MEKDLGFKHTASDAWVLCAIVLASKQNGATLANIIAYGDAVNRKILSHEELESGLFRLTQSGWVEEKAGRFEPTRKAEGVYSRIGGIGKTLARIMEEFRNSFGVEGDLSSEPYPNPENRHRYPGFTPEKYKQAVLAHQNRTASRKKSRRK